MAQSQCSGVAKSPAALGYTTERQNRLLASLGMLIQLIQLLLSLAISCSLLILHKESLTLQHTNICMACCSGSCSGGSPLARYARELSSKHVEDALDALPFFFPMYTVSLQVLLEMVDIKVHEELLAEGSLVIFDETRGKAAFVSHQWVA